MPPKGSKRRVSKSGPAPEPKQAKTDPPEQQAVLEALGRSPSLTTDARVMLAAILPYSLGVVSDERDVRQTMVVNMFEQTIYGIRSELAASVEAASNKVAEAEAAKGKLAADVVECEARLKEYHEATQTAKASLEAKKEASKASSTEEKKAEGALKAFEAHLEDQQQLKARLEELLGAELKVLSEGTFTDAKEAKKLAAALMKVTSKLAIEASLNHALLPSCTRPLAERSSFDSMVLQQVNEQLTAKASELGQELGAVGPKLEEHRAAVHAVKAASEAAQADQDAGVAALKEAQQRDHEAKVALTQASKASDAAEPAIEKAKKALMSATAVLTAFEVGAVQSFEALRDRGKPQPEAEPEAQPEAPAAEQATPEA